MKFREWINVEEGTIVKSRLFGRAQPIKLHYVITRCPSEPTCRGSSTNQATRKWDLTFVAAKFRDVLFGCYGWGSFWRETLHARNIHKIRPDTRITKIRYTWVVRRNDFPRKIKLSPKIRLKLLKYPIDCFPNERYVFTCPLNRKCWLCYLKTTNFANWQFLRNNWCWCQIPWPSAPFASRVRVFRRTGQVTDVLFIKILFQYRGTGKVIMTTNTLITEHKIENGDMISPGRVNFGVRLSRYYKDEF